MLRVNKPNERPEGRPMCKIEGGHFNGTTVTVLNTNPAENLITNGSCGKMDVTNVAIPREDIGKFQQLPNTKSEREILYIAGPSGSGKSTYAKNYMKQYNVAYPSNPIFIFSAIYDPEAFEEVKNIYYVKIKDESYIKEPPTVEELKNSLVLFDDVDMLDEPIRGVTFSLLKKVLEIGRHFKISAILTMHALTDRDKTRTILNECHSVTYFPYSGSTMAIKYLLLNYVGLDVKNIEDIKKTGSRWATVFKNYPMTIMTEKKIAIASEF